MSVMFPSPKAATRLLDEMCHLTVQSFTSLETSDHFQVVKMLGEGSYGKVMLAVHRKRGTPMALKFFPRDSTNLFSFLREYNLSLSFCTHPSLTKALGIVFSTPTHYVFAQQASLFGDLYDVIVPEVGVEEDCVQRVVSQLSSALTHLHSLGFVHRDVKPENIFLVDAACRWVKLGDFGMAKATGTKVPGVWYSSAYCTPEAEIVGTDCWALGILIYAMLTGSLPWTETASDDRSLDEGTRNLNKKKSNPVAPQFAYFTPLACSLFQALLHPQPGLRGRPDDVLGYLGGDWLWKKEKLRLEEERKRIKGREVIRNGKERQGRVER
uniref:Si:ch211-171h4.3 n=1 Tax=Oncorhynchus mykiss TaxID=8022 RepID=A0A8C7WIP6_ONCMY